VMPFGYFKHIHIIATQALAAIVYLTPNLFSSTSVWHSFVFVSIYGTTT
jgi:hypothetical protein